jgi:sterol desaturase/sphingolipid hydroxylase (fatty acid hydroxylase superfamily)
MILIIGDIMALVTLERLSLRWNIFAYISYPLLLISGIFIIIITFRYNINYSLVSSLFLIFVISYLALMEHLIPYNKSWLASSTEWLRDAIYLFITMLGGGLAVAFINMSSAYLSTPDKSLPLALELAFGLCLSSLGSYIFHRLSHVWPWLWRFHGIHHLDNKVNVGNNGVNHLLDVCGRRLLAQAPFVLLGLSPQAVFILGIFNIIQGYFSHANIQSYLGFFNYIIVGPEQHRLHHSTKLKEAGHFSTDIPLWDLCFKTYTWHPGRIPKKIGVVTPRKFPSPDNIIECLLYPLRYKKYYKPKAF